MNEREIFAAALEKDSPGEIRRFLDEVCGERRALRNRLELLLQAHRDPDSLLERPVFKPTSPDREPQFESPGTRIGPYLLLETIGEGGFGVVYLAEQTAPVRRQVALKIVKPGMDSRQVIARFDAERQALAMMDHPNIAKVLDAGTTESGRPYFAMELVHGVPITDYCDRCNVTIRARLELFITVCHAVQHAHQKGVIHRDIKPTNVLVAMQDGRAAPIIIDFGVAKATGERLTEHTLATRFTQIIGTPLYMSPEQAELSPLGVDTRSDIYSLGVLLYELLTGTTPFDKELLHEASYDELRRIIREEEPPRPSARVSTLKAGMATTVAEYRRTDCRRLVQTVRGDLDWIVMKCVDKDRNRRYSTANGLARDVQRYLDDEPVHACPPSAMYRFGKFARRNKVALAAASAVVATLLLAVVGLAVSNRWIATERNEKAAALEAKEQALARAEAERRRAEANFRRARMAVRGILSDAARGVGEWSELSPSLREKFAQETVNYYEGLLQEGSDDPSMRYETAVGYRSLSVMYNSLDQREQAESFLRKSIDILDDLVAQYPDVRQYRHQLAYSQYTLGLRIKAAEQLTDAVAALNKSVGLYESLVARQPDHGDYYLELAVAYRSLIRLQDTLGATHDARRSTRQLADLLRRAAATSPQVSDGEMFWRLALVPKVPPAAPIAPDVSIGIVEALINVRRWEEAVAACREIGATDPDDPLAHYCLSYALESGGHFPEAVGELQDAIALQPEYVDAHNGLAWLLSTCPDIAIRDPHRAVVHASRAVELAPTLGALWNTLGIAHYRAGDFEAAKRALEKSTERQRDDAFVLFFLAMAEWQLGHEAPAREWNRRSVEWMEHQRPNDEVLIRFRNEAADLLGLPES